MANDPDGKTTTILKICQEKGIPLTEELPVAMIGDGDTDMRTGEKGIFTINYRGIAQREGIEQKANMIARHKNLTALLPYLTTIEQQRKLLKIEYAPLPKAAYEIPRTTVFVNAKKLNY